MTILGGTRPVAVMFALTLLSVAATTPLGHAEQSAGWEAYANKDYETAARLWREDAAHGDPNAAFGLAILAERAGDGKAAATWYEKAARGGHVSAQVLIGQRYAEGQGVEKSPVAAYAWYTRAIASGVPNATKLRDHLAAGMSPDQVKQAEALAETLVKP